MKKKFPTFPVLLLVIAVAWFISDIGYLHINLPWIPLALIVVSIGWIVNRYT